MRTKTQAYNSTFAKGGFSFSIDSFMVTKNSMLRIGICVEKHAHRKSSIR